MPALTVAEDGLRLTAGASLTVRVNAWTVSGASPFEAVRTSEYVPPEPGAGVPESSPVPTPAVKVIPLGRSPLTLTVAGAGVPGLVVIWKEPVAPTVKVVLAGLVKVGDSTTDTVNACESAVPNPLSAPIVTV